MASLLLMPEFAATELAEATLSQWVVSVGVPFEVGDTIVVVETAKAAVDVDADAAGVILRTLVAEGAEVQVGDAIALLGAPGDVVADVDLVLAELGVSDGVVGTPPPASLEPPATSTTDEPSVTSDGARPRDDGTARIFASPLARRLAREAGLGLDDLVGTGPNGRIVRDDVESAKGRRADGEPAATAVGSAPAPEVPSSSPRVAAGWTEIPHTRVRRAIARRLAESQQTAPHFSLTGRANVDQLLQLRAEINGSTDTRLSVNDLVIKAVAHAHTVVPAMNVIWTADAVRQFESVDVAVAVASDNGLVTPVLRGADAKSVRAIAAETRDLVGRARAGRLKQHELEGGTVSVTNLGMFGTRGFSAIINPPHAAILAVGAATSEPVAVDGNIVVASVMQLTVSVDHRPVDGATAAEWMRALVDVLEHPLALLV